jgi:signal transduction histidine kinase
MAREGEVPDPRTVLASPRTGSRREGRLRARIAAVPRDAWSRLLVGLAAPALAAIAGQQVPTWLFAIILVHAATGLVTTPSRWVYVGDVLLTGVLIVALGGRILPVVPYLLLLVARTGREAGPLPAAGVGTLHAITLVATLYLSARIAEVGLGGALATAALFPVTGLTAAAADRFLRARAAPDRVVLQEANRLLSGLRAVADHLPGGLDVATVSAALIAEIRAITTCRAVMVFVEEGGLLEPTAAVGVEHGTPRRVRLDELRHHAATSASAARFLTPQGLPPALRTAAAAARHWTTLALGPSEDLAGVVVVGFDDLDSGRTARPRLAAVAADAGIALDNARLFDGTQARAADTARRRLAGDLHDGVAQSLAHLRMELELRSLAAGDEGEELARLAHLARHTLQELRATISDLRRPLDGDIDVQLRRHIDRLTSAATPPIDFASYGRAAVDPARSEQVLRIAQEALSNALRHARPERITVTLERDTAALELTVEDDGVGLRGPSPTAGGGVGMRSMRERATLLGGTLDVRERRGGGTVVHLRCPTASAPDDAIFGRSR